MWTLPARIRFLGHEDHWSFTTVLTLVLVALCLGAAYTAQRLHRRELVWIAVTLAVISAYKLVVQDLSHAPAFGVVLSLLAYGGALSLLPRFTRWKTVAN